LNDGEHAIATRLAAKSETLAAGLPFGKAT
jgi:hypothetical protein